MAVDRLVQDDQAFVLRIPQEKVTTDGVVACELALAPTNLEEYRKRHAAADDAEQKRDKPRRKLTHNEIRDIDPKAFGKARAEEWKRRLDTRWELTEVEGVKMFEHRTRIIRGDVLYSFVLICDEEHFEAFLLDFEEMLAAVKLTPPHTGVEKMPGGYWMQSKLRFALELPDGWRPTFAPDDKVRFLAKGQTHEVFTDNLMVLSTDKRGLDFEQLKTAIAKQIAATYPDAKSEIRVVRFGPGATEALETEIHFKQGPFALSILEWRFTGPSRNYEIKFTCESTEFAAHADEYRRALQSFVEVAEDAPPPGTM
ncbi:MAG: hypothetical protein QM811_11025 [Pirellulales bacterium]